MRLERDPDSAVIGGVCSALARRLQIDPVIVRVAVALLVIASSGVALIPYLVAWALIPAKATAGAAEPAPKPRAKRVRTGHWRVAAGAGLLTLSLLLVLRELGLWWSDALIWPLILAASGGTLLWRQAQSRAATTPPSAVREVPSREAEAATQRSRLLALYRGGFGVALVLGAVLVFLSANDVLGETRDVVLTVIAATAGLALILAPFLWRLGRNLATERAERIRSEERAEVAAHLHDSVLQTLALVQKRAGDPREVAQLARRQERELRTWLFDGRAPDASKSLSAALEQAAAEVEDAHGVAIEVVAVGDAPINERTRPVADAAREAMVNAAKFAPETGEVAVFAELGEGRAEVFIRDRGPGFDRDAVPADRRGISESIVGRMERAGGHATIRSRPGAGTEVELAIEIGDER